ncbi:transmembrane emp24 domain-containing protein 1-like [Aulostomus maculatus]
MDSFLRKEGSRRRPLVLTVFLGWCFVSVRCFDVQENEYTFVLPAGRSDCFFLTAVKDGSLEVEYQVIRGASMDVDFSIVSPAGIKVATGHRSSKGLHMVDPSEDGDYKVCFDNSFSRFSEKMVFFETYIDGQGVEDWVDLDEPEESLLEYKLEDIRSSMESLQQRLHRSRQMQAMLRAYESRDRKIQENNLWRVTVWSLAGVLVMVGVAFAQVFTVRKMFDNKRKFHS